MIGALVQSAELRDRMGGAGTRSPVNPACRIAIVRVRECRRNGDRRRDDAAHDQRIFQRLTRPAKARDAAADRTAGRPRGRTHVASGARVSARCLGEF